FFFQAEDGIRDYKVTGVQTCALPIYLLEDGLNVTIDLKADSVEIEGAARDVARAEQVFSDYDQLQRCGYTFNNGDLGSMLRVLRSEERRVGKEWRSGWWQ